jgi:glycerol-3-phosphate dehydrogenase
VAGIQSPGLTAAPAIAREVLEMLVAEGLELVPRKEFDPHLPAPPRFAQQSVDRRREMAAANGRFGKVVCRCELVVEGEIDMAIDHGARTLDGVKFRTRAGMGRCQSGFCTPRIMEMLSERLGIPLHEVTKRGGDSWVVIPMTQGAEAGGEVDRERDADADAEPGSCSGA